MPPAGRVMVKFSQAWHLEHYHDDALPAGTVRVQITHARLARINTRTSLLQHALSCLFPEVEAVVASHQHLDTVHKLVRRAGIRANDDVFLHKVNGDASLVERRPVLEVPVESVSLFHENRPAGMFLETRQHLGEAGSATLFGRLDVDELLQDHEAFFQRVLAKQALLSRDGEPFLLLILAGDSGVEHALALLLCGAALCRWRSAGFRRSSRDYGSCWHATSTLIAVILLRFQPPSLATNCSARQE